MNATVSELQGQTREVLRAVIQNGEEVVLTDSGRPVARIVPYIPTVTVTPEQARADGQLTDESILEAIREARDDEADGFDPQ